MSGKPVVYFVDDSATMREVIKIAFRREEMEVITCHDAQSAMDLMEHSAPDVIISDVIMPGRDGYELCLHVRQHPRFTKTPVILMSGVVNKGVAERAFAVQANELVRKPFQPQDLIARVRHLLAGNGTEPQAAVAVAEVARPQQQQQQAGGGSLSSIFSAPAPGRGSSTPARAAGPVPVPPRTRQAPSIAATVAAAMQPQVLAPPVAIPGARITGATKIPVPPQQPGRVPPPPAHGVVTDIGKLRLEILRLHSQVKKLQLELLAEREYTKALEQHVLKLQDSDK